MTVSGLFRSSIFSSDGTWVTAGPGLATAGLPSSACSPRLREGDHRKQFWRKKIGLGVIRRSYLTGKTSIPGSFVRDIGVLEIDLQKVVILRRRNSHPEKEGIKNEHLASTKRSFVICTLAQLPGFVPYVELPKIVNQKSSATFARVLSFSRANFHLCLRDHRSRSSLARAPPGALISEIQPHVPKCVRVAIFGASKVHEKSMR